MAENLLLEAGIKPQFESYLVPYETLESMADAYVLKTYGCKEKVRLVDGHDDDGEEEVFFAYYSPENIDDDTTYEMNDDGFILDDSHELTHSVLHVLCGSDSWIEPFKPGTAKVTMNARIDIKKKALSVLEIALKSDREETIVAFNTFMKDVSR